MPLDDPEGGISLAVEYFRDQLAACARFQTLCNVDTSELARARTWANNLPPPADDAGVFSRDELVSFRPFALVWSERYRRNRVGTGCYAEGGTIHMQLEQSVPEALANDPQQLLRRFENDLGVIISELETLAYTAGYLAYDTLEMQGPWREDINAIPQQGDHVFAFLTLEWGTGE